MHPGELADRGLPPDGQAIEIHAGPDRAAVLVAPVPARFVAPGGDRAVHERPHAAAREVVNAELRAPRIRRKAEGDEGDAGTRVRPALAELEPGRGRARPHVPGDP